MASRILRRLRDLTDVTWPGSPTDGHVLTYDSGTDKIVLEAASGGGGGASAAEDVTFAPAGSVASTDVQAAIEELDSEKASASHVHAGEDITSGTVADARIASTIARDSEVTSAISALSSVYQPLDSDLTAIAALTTTTFGRSLLAVADAAAARSTISAPPIKKGLVSGRWYTGRRVPGTLATATFTPTQNRIYFAPFDIEVATAFQSMFAWVITAQASNTFRLGIYGDTSGAPGALIVDAGTIDASSTGAKTVSISVTANPGRLWLAIVQQGGAGGARVLWQPCSDLSEFDATNGNVFSTVSSSTSVSGALPDPAGTSVIFDTSGTSLNAPWLGVRVT